MHFQIDEIERATWKQNKFRVLYQPQTIDLGLYFCQGPGIEASQQPTQQQTLLGETPDTTAVTTESLPPRSSPLPMSSYPATLRLGTLLLPRAGHRGVPATYPTADTTWGNTRYHRCDYCVIAPSLITSAHVELSCNTPFGYWWSRVYRYCYFGNVL
ncbi:hypothetical protein Pcinc_006075 [Petrolisthes cinctipes]|uniref:Uncharacterized protein n=1 Tax=Petrolisthes cinctipes TaxID=88211 RepID=A0AAE1GDM7_PETCI|nr:hypothetical protein Pcinc_006075 [Petrolisthes cinctipes]